MTQNKIILFNYFENRKNLEKNQGAQNSAFHFSLQPLLETGFAPIILYRVKCELRLRCPHNHVYLFK